jgi:acetyl-CoA carboxylase biotin carboxyl carrier protein
MNIKQIRELAQIVRENGLSALEVSENESRIRIECERKEVAATVVVPEHSEVPVVAPVISMPQEEAPVDFNRVHEIKSPMVGVFYASPAPDAKPFVEVGSRVKVGDVVCIVEAMKLMNEITADFEGEVVDICVKNGEVVEYGQPLFKLC